MTGIVLNGVATETQAPSIQALVEAKLAGADNSAIAVAVNGMVVRRALWTHSVIAEGDRIEILTALQGG